MPHPTLSLSPVPDPCPLPRCQALALGGPVLSQPQLLSGQAAATRYHPRGAKFWPRGSLAGSSARLQPKTRGGSSLALVIETRGWKGLAEVI